MRRLLLVFLFGIIGLHCFSQSNPHFVIAKYYDGSIFNGISTGESQGILALELITGDTISVNRKYAKEVLDRNNAIIYKDFKHHKTTGNFWDFSMGFNASSFGSDDSPISSHMRLMYGTRLHGKLCIAGGLGLEFNEASVGGFIFNSQLFSLFGYGKYYLTDRRRRIYAFGRIGFGFTTEEQINGINNEQQGGFNGKYGLGILFPSKRKSRFQLNLGHYFQKMSGREFFLDAFGNEIETTYDLLVSRLILSFGWEFN